ncbi:MAG TPA: choline-sulfatase [Dongiaceae bacterium]
MARPNIVVVMFDQMAALSLPVYGHPLVKTPTLDRLAKQGTAFDQAYCAAPLCSPARFALMSGQLPSKIGAFDNATEFPSSVPTLPHYLRAAGYRTCLSGKMDFTGADQLHGYEERLTTDLSPSDFGWVPDWEQPDQVQNWYHTLQSPAEAGPCDYSLSMQYDEDALFKAEQWLHQAAGSDDGRPFMLTLSVMHPHDPYQAPRRFWDLYEDVAIDPPALPNLPEEQRDAMGRLMYRLYDRGEIPLNADQVLRARRAYYGMLSYCDDLLGRLLAKLDLLGLSDNTIVVVTSDHGDMLGERGLWYKMVFFDRAIRVPLIIAGPGIRAAKRIAAPVSHLDLLPTLAGIAQGGGSFTPISPVDGRDLRAALSFGNEPQGDVRAEYMGEGYTAPAVMIRRGHRKFIYGSDLGPTLYDLAADPLETDNLAPGSEAALATAWQAEVEAAYDFTALRKTVIDSQHRRRFIHQALTRGAVAPWDYEPRNDAAKQYYRNYGLDQPDPDRALRWPPRR